MPKIIKGFWTRKLELELVDFIRQREFVWKTAGNTNHHIQQKYKAYAEFAAKLGRGFTACAVRDRWVNIRSTFNHNLRKVDRSRLTAASSADIYVPCWPLWKPLQFLREVPRKDNAQYENYPNYEHLTVNVKEETHSEVDDIVVNIRQRAEPTDKPHRKPKPKSSKCIEVLDNLIIAMKPLVQKSYPEQKYWFFGRHVTEQLNSMRDLDAKCASQEIMNLLTEWSSEENFLKPRYIWDDLSTCDKMNVSSQ